MGTEAEQTKLKEEAERKGTFSRTAPVCLFYPRPPDPRIPLSTPRTDSGLHYTNRNSCIPIHHISLQADILPVHTAMRPSATTHLIRDAAAPTLFHPGPRIIKLRREY